MLRVWLPLDGDLRNLGTSEVIITNHGATINNSGKIGKCYQFDNSSSYIELNSSELYKILNGDTQPFSVCFWVNQIDSSRAIILGDFSVSGGNNFNIELNVNHNLRWYWGTPDIGISAMNVGINTWTHVTFTYSGTVLKGYINGIEKYTNTITLNKKNRTSGSYYLGRDGRTGTTTLNGYLNDFRIYDHALSAAEVREIAQGLVVHYKLDNPLEEINNSNICYSPIKDNGSYSSASPNWDTTKHEGAIEVPYWSNGYNGGVAEPEKGYHAMWKLIDGIPTIVLQNHNSEIGRAGRWLGVVTTTALKYSIPPGMKYTISYDQKTLDTLGGYTTAGNYYKTSSSSNISFHDGCPKIGQNTVLNKWEHFSYTFTRSSAADGTRTSGSIYIYGYAGTESTMLVRNIKLEVETYTSTFWDSVKNNIFSSFTTGGQTTLNNGIITTSGANADTYFHINTTKTLVKEKNYIIEIYCSGLPDDGYWNFGVGAQNSSSAAYAGIWKIKNGFNTFTFTCPSGLNGATRFILDDSVRPYFNYKTSFHTARVFENDGGVVIDSSGYGHNGTINGTLNISNDTPRYSFSSYMPKSTTISHARPVYGGIDQEWTCCMWVKLDTTSQSMQQMNNFNSGNNIVHGTNGQPLLYLNSGTNDYYNYGNLAVSAGVWTHIAFVFKNSNATKLIYINGVNHTNTSGPNKTSTPKGIPDIITVGTNLAGYISDYRIYCTPLLDKDIKLLYNTSSRVDNLGNSHSFEIEENENIKIQKNGVFKAPLFVEEGFKLNNVDGWSYNPSGATNSSINGAVVDFTPFVGLNKPITIQIEGDLSWENITPNGNGNFSAYFQGKQRKLDGTWEWSGTNYSVPANIVSPTTLMTENSTGSIHFKNQRTIPVTWFETYNASHVGYRTNYATGTITLSNLKITLAPEQFQIKSTYVAGNNFIEM